MRMPIKLNKSYWPKMMTNLLPSCEDPNLMFDGEICGEQFSKAISMFKFGTTNKTTKSRRFPATIAALRSINYHSPPTVLDVGASDGITSLHVIQNIDYNKFYVTDLNPEAFCDTRDGRCYFYDMHYKCILIVTKLFVIYSEFNDSIFPFNVAARYFFSKSQNTNNALRKIELINPELKKVAGNIVIAKYDIFKKWMNEKVDLIIAANILNRDYFSETQILKAVNNLVCALNDGGRFVIVDSRKIEKATIFRVMNKRIISEKDINGGTEIKALILKACLE
jgi:hypothetical protein